jgi:hypothetical protein
MKYLIALAVSVLMIGNVAAQDETLNGRLITRIVNATFVDAPGVEGRSVGGGQYAGIAVFDDGRLADKQFVLLMDNGGAEGSYSGYATYTFQNGDALTLRFTGGWDPDGQSGDYEVLSGTGAYEGATGTGRFVAVKDPWKKATLYDLTINIKHGDR